MDKKNLKTLFKPNTDCYYILDYLSKYDNWQNVIDIIKAKSFNENNPLINWACRSRISDTRKRILPYGWDIRSRIGKNRQAEYRLISTDFAIKEQLVLQEE